MCWAHSGVRTEIERNGRRLRIVALDAPRRLDRLVLRPEVVVGDSEDFVHLDWSTARKVALPNLKPTSTAISLRLPVGLLERIKVAANKRDVPYQSLIKTWLAEKVDSTGK